MSIVPAPLRQWLLRRYKTRVRVARDLSLANALAVAEATVTATPYAFLITQSRSGAPSARLVEPLFDAHNWVFRIGTSRRSRKFAQVGLNPSVTLAYGDIRRHAQVVVSGNLRIVDDAAQSRAMFKPAWRLFFPDGPDGDDFVLLELAARRMEVLHFRRALVPEPFGLRAVRLERKDYGWTPVED